MIEGPIPIMPVGELEVHSVGFGTLEEVVMSVAEGVLEEEEESSEGEDVEEFIVLVGQIVLSSIVKTDLPPRMFVQSHLDITYWLIPLSPPPRSAHSPTTIPIDWEQESVGSIHSLSRCNTIVQASPKTAEMGIQVDHAQQMTWAQMMEMVSEQVRLHSLARVMVELH